MLWYRATQLVLSTSALCAVVVDAYAYVYVCTYIYIYIYIYIIYIYIYIYIYIWLWVCVGFYSLRHMPMRLKATTHLHTCMQARTNALKLPPSLSHTPMRLATTQLNTTHSAVSACVQTAAQAHTDGVQASSFQTWLNHAFTQTCLFIIKPAQDSDDACTFAATATATMGSWFPYMDPRSTPNLKGAACMIWPNQ